MKNSRVAGWIFLIKTPALSRAWFLGISEIIFCSRESVKCISRNFCRHADEKRWKTSGTRGILHFLRLTSFAAAKVNGGRKIYKTSSENNIPACVYQNLKSRARKRKLGLSCALRVFLIFRISRFLYAENFWAWKSFPQECTKGRGVCFASGWYYYPDGKVNRKGCERVERTSAFKTRSTACVGVNENKWAKYGRPWIL